MPVLCCLLCRDRVRNRGCRREREREEPEGVEDGFTEFVEELIKLGVSFDSSARYRVGL